MSKADDKSTEANSATAESYRMPTRENHAIAGRLHREASAAHSQYLAEKAGSSVNEIGSCEEAIGFHNQQAMWHEQQAAAEIPDDIRTRLNLGGGTGAHDGTPA